MLILQKLQEDTAALCYLVCLQRLTFVLEPRNPEQNHLLAALLPVERERIYPHLQLVPMPLGKVLYESGDVQRHVYFPIDSIVSLLYVICLLYTSRCV